MQERALVPQGFSSRGSFRRKTSSNPSRTRKSRRKHRMGRSRHSSIPNLQTQVSPQIAQSQAKEL
jgi:hypothetical protein